MSEAAEASLEDLVLATWIEDTGVYLQLDPIEQTTSELPVSLLDLTTID